MITVRQIERMWIARQYRKLSEELLTARQEAAFELEGTDSPCFVAALAIIRLDELNQAGCDLSSALVRTILASQERDGSWGSLAATALCLRALLVSHGEGLAVDAAMEYLKSTQKESGIWPNGPLRRMPEDATGSLFALLQLGDQACFRRHVRFRDAMAWFARNRSLLPARCRALCDWAMVRLQPHTMVAEPVLFAA